MLEKNTEKSEEILSIRRLPLTFFLSLNQPMYIYNVTINIDGSVHEEWLSWIQDHIQEVLATGSFVAAKLTQVLVEEEMGGVTYSVQYTANSREDLNEYYTTYAPKLRNESMQRFADKMISFRTELKVIKEFYPPSIKN